MSAFKGTPGPWEAKRTYPQEWAINAPNGDPALKHGTWHGLAVVYGCDESPSVGREVAEANARLIAAAPDGLTAGTDLLHVVKAAIRAGDWKVDGACDPDAAIRRMEQFIAKATGEQS